MLINIKNLADAHDRGDQEGRSEELECLHAAALQEVRPVVADELEGVDEVVHAVLARTHGVSTRSSSAMSA